MTTKKERPTRLEINCETGEQTIVELTDEEIAQLEIDRATWLAEEVAREAAEKAKTEAKISALAKLTTLGLTEDEAKALTGN